MISTNYKSYLAQLVADEPEYFPATQLVHTDTPVPTALYIPDAQFPHELPPEAD